MYLNDFDLKMCLNDFDLKTCLNDFDILRSYSYKNIKGYSNTNTNNNNNDITIFTEKILKQEPFIILKYGDGELLCMISNDASEKNCDSCNYFKDLSLSLIQSYIYFLKNENAYICKWPFTTFNIQERINDDYKDYYDENTKFLYYDILIHKIEHTSTFPKDLIDFYKCIQNSKLEKIYISNQNMITALCPLLNIEHNVVVPEINSFLNNNVIIKNIIENITKNNNMKILLFSAGMNAKVLIAKISEKYPNNIYLDIGSSFDGLIKGSRDFNKVSGYRDLLSNQYLQQ